MESTRSADSEFVHENELYNFEYVYASDPIRSYRSIKKPNSKKEKRSPS